MKKHLAVNMKTEAHFFSCVGKTAKEQRVLKKFPLKRYSQKKLSKKVYFG
jgi:hypothetical protein